jgi:hypothetical protein
MGVVIESGPPSGFQPLSQESEDSHHLTAGCGGLDGDMLLESVKRTGACSGKLPSARLQQAWIIL